jgi:hypothetical protein
MAFDLGLLGGIWRLWFRRRGRHPGAAPVPHGPLPRRILSAYAAARFFVIAYFAWMGWTVWNFDFRDC